MKILYLVDSYYPEVRSATRLARDLVREFAAQGHEVTLLTPSAEISSPMTIDREGEVRIVRVRSGPTKGINRVIRALNEVRLSTGIWRRARTFLEANRHDLVVSYSPTIFFGDLVHRLKRVWGARSYLILRDIFPQWAAETGVLSRRHPAYWYFARKARNQYTAADVIGVQSAGDLKHFNGAARRVEVLYNWLKPELPAPDGVDRRARYGLGNRFVFFYGGNIGVAQNLDLVVRLAAELADNPRAYVLLVGDGHEVPRLSAEISRRRLGNIAIHPSVPEDEYFRLLADMDVGLISLDPRLTNNNFPAKLLGYLALGKPVLAALNPGHELFDLLAKSDTGLAAVASDEGTFFEHARRLLNDPAAVRRMGENGPRLLASRFSAAAAARQIAAHFTPARP